MLLWALLAIAGMAAVAVVVTAILHREFSEQFLAALIVVQLGLALAAAVAVYTHLQGLTRERRRHAVVEALLGTLALPRDIEETASVTVARLVESGVAPAALLALTKDGSDTLHPIAACGYPEGQDLLPASIAVPGAPVTAIEDAAADAWLGPLSSSIAPRPWVARVPVTDGDEVLGLLLLASPSRDAFNDEKLLRTIGSTVAAALDHARMYQAAFERARNLEEHNARRREFMYAIAHELRSPLTSVHAFTELWPAARNSGLDETPLLDSLSKSIGRVRALVDDLLDLCKVEESTLRVRVVPVDIVAAIQAIEASLRPAFAARAQSLTLELPPEPLLVSADVRALDQVLANLISNANRFTPERGAIVVRARATEDRVHIEVCDSGPGIDPADRDRIFEPFYRVHRRDAPEVPGYGLGLAVAHRLTELQGGRLWVESADEGGARFCLELPAATADAEAPPPAA